MEFPDLPDDLSSLTDDDLGALHDQLVAAFNEATADGAVLSDEDVASFAAVADNVELIRTEQGIRQEAASARAEQLSSLADRVNASTEPEPTTEADEDAETEDEGGEETATEDEGQPAAQSEPVLASNTTTPKPKAVTATIATMKRNAPARTRPRQEEPINPVTITAAADITGFAAGSSLNDLDQIAQAMSARANNMGPGSEDPVPVVQFKLNVDKSRHFSAGEDITSRIKDFDKSPQGIQAAGGLCAPVNNYYDQMVISEAARPVKAALANFSADRGGIKYNPPPSLASITSGVGTVTVAQDLAGGGPATKGCFTVTCTSPVEQDITAIYTCLDFGNIGARAWPENVAAFTKLALAKQARVAETLLLDRIAASSTAVTAAGFFGAGRELFVNIGRAAAGMRSRQRMSPDARISVLLPAWTLDLVQADFARTFTDESGFISMSDADITKLFDVRNLDVNWYLDSKTGGGQVFGAIAGGQTFTDGTTASNTTVTSASAAFTSADVGRTITGAGIPSGTTITVVGSGTSVTISQAATATATGVSITIGRPVLAQYPTTVYAYIFPQGSYLHLDMGTLDLGLVRDSTLNATNRFRTFTETFEEAALIGPESIELALALTPDGSYAAARTITNPINT